MTDTKPAPVIDCRTCTHYVQGQHACNLFYTRGQECIEGSQWQAMSFAPLWKVGK